MAERKKQDMMPPRPGRWRMVAQNLLAIGIAILFIVGLPFLWNEEKTPASKAPPPDPRMGQSMDGKVIYEEFCGYCHGFKLDGQSSWFAPTQKDAVESPRLDAEGNTWKLSDRSLFEITKNGGQSIAIPGVESKMPAFDRVISDQQIEAAIGYIKTVWPDDIHEWRKKNGKTRG